MLVTGLMAERHEGGTDPLQVPENTDEAVRKASA
jgi:hypothetical protein